MALWACLGLLTLLQGCGGNPISNAKEIYDQSGRVHRIGGAVNASSCLTTQALLGKRDLKKIREFQRKKRPAEKSPACIGSANRGKRVNLRLRRDGAVYCPDHGSYKDGRAPLEEVQDDIRPPDSRPFDPDLDSLALMFFGAGLLSAMAAGYFSLQGGETADLIEALHAAETIPSKEAGHGYACVAGTITCKQVLLAPRLREPVVYYRYRQIEEWEQRNKNGHWIPFSRVLKEDVERVVFEIQDSSGCVTVQSGGAKIQGRKLFEAPVTAGDKDTGTGMGSSGSFMGSKYRKHRFIHEVYGVAVGDQALVIGESNRNANEEVFFQKGQEKSLPFIVAVGTRETLMTQQDEAAAIHTMLTWALGGLSLLFFVGGFLVPGSP